MTLLWLGWHEARSRPVAFSISAAIVAAAVAVSSGLELGSRAREAAISSQMDKVAPGIRVVPAGVGSTELRRLELGDSLLPIGLQRRLSDVVGKEMRRIEARLIERHEVMGTMAPVVGVGDTDVDYGFLGGDPFRGQSVIVGQGFAGKIAVGQVLDLWGQRWTVRQILPQRGTVDDASLFVSLGVLQRVVGQPAGINELRLYPHHTEAIPRTAQRIREAHPAVSVFESADRRGDAEVETEASLARYRGVLHTLTTTAVAMVLFLSAFVEVRERTSDVAMLAALGARSSMIAGTLVGRFAGAAGLGSIVGLVLSATAIVSLEPAAALAMPWPWAQMGAIALGAIVTTIAAVMPAAGVAVTRDHVKVLSA